MKEENASGQKTKSEVWKRGRIATLINRAEQHAATTNRLARELGYDTTVDKQDHPAWKEAVRLQAKWGYSDGKR